MVATHTGPLSRRMAGSPWSSMQATLPGCGWPAIRGPLCDLRPGRHLALVMDDEAGLAAAYLVRDGE